MAYRRKQQGTTTTVGTGLGRSGWRPSPISTSTSTSSLGVDVGANKDLLEDVEDVDFDVGVEDDSSSTSLAAKAIRASSAAHRDSSLSSAYGFSHRFPPSYVSSSAATTTSFSTSKPTTTSTSSSFSKDSRRYEYTSVKSVTDEPKQQGFWGSLARKAKSFLDDNDLPDQVESPGQSRYKVPDFGSKAKYQGSYASDDNNRKMESPKLEKGLNAISSSLNYIGNAVGEGLTIVENRTADIIQETRKHIRKKPSGSAALAQGANCGNSWQQTQTQSQNLPQLQTDLELQLKASRDVAMAMAAKAKLLLRDLKTVKADLAFAKERCAQLEDENRVLRENRERGGNLEDDDLIRLQLETLLAEKARLAHENSAYARENRFLREVVEYHQLTMQDVIYLDEGTEEITEVYPIKVVSNTQPISPTNLNVSLPSESTIDTCLGVTGNICPVRPPGVIEVSQSVAPPISYTTTKT